MRKRRELKPNATYKVIARVNRDNMELSPPVIKKMFLNTMKRLKKKYSFLIKNFVILNNSVYILIQPLRNESLSRIMQWLLSVFAKSFNKKYGIKGHLWRARFISRIIDNITDFMRTFKELNELPVKLKLIKDHEEYIYSGLYHIKRHIYNIIDRFPEYKRISKMLRFIY